MKTFKLEMAWMQEVISFLLLSSYCHTTIGLSRYEEAKMTVKPCVFHGCLPTQTHRRKVKPQIRHCPGDIYAESDPIQINAAVSWKEPVAFDYNNEEIKITRYGPGPGYTFNEGSTTVGYYAIDNQGNSASCKFKVHIHVARCKKRSGRIKDGYRMCHPSTDIVKGTVCSYGCYHGHELKGGPPKIECMPDGSWNSLDEPHCEKIKCKTLPLPIDVHQQCTNGSDYRSICTNYCDKGFDVKYGLTRTMLCRANGKWDGDEPECQDIEPPVFDRCQSTLMFYTARNRNKTLIHWNDPQISDNNDNNLQAEQISGPKPGSFQIADTYMVTYTAKDKTNNTATNNCIFNVVVKQIKCPPVYPLPNTLTHCSGNHYGSECFFSCDGSRNYKINGSNSSVCEIEGIPSYGKWTKLQPFCQFVASDCPVLTPPDNGALACDTWLGGKICHPSCQAGYDVRKKLPNLIVCQDDNVWWHGNDLTDCEKTKPSGRRIMRGEFYFNGICSDEKTKEDIKQQFIAVLKRSIMNDKCKQPNCKIENVKVLCGQSSTKRSTDSSKIGFEIVFSQNSSVLTSEQYESEFKMATNIMKTLDIEVRNISFRIGSNSAAIHSVNAGNLQVECSENSVPVFSTEVACLPCPPGTKFDYETNKCESCPKGSYQQHEGKAVCDRCASTKTTVATGTKNRDQCFDACLPGSWSETGIQPCSPCYVGTFENEYGSVRCKKCQSGKITKFDGSTAQSDCQDFDISFQTELNSSTSLSNIVSRNMSYFHVSLHFQCRKTCNGEIFNIRERQTSILNLTAVDGKIILSNRDLFSLGNRQQKKWQHLMITFTPDHTQVTINGGDSFVVNDLSTSVMETMPENSLSITLGTEFDGIISQFNMFTNKDENEILFTKPPACFHNNLNPNIISWGDLAHSDLTGSYIVFPSICDDFDECVSNPCQNGNCTDLLGRYACNCNDGFTGLNCEENIDDCIANSCQNNSTCIDGPNMYTCQCPNHFTGRFCEIAMVDGEWTEWDNWTVCSVSCGNGTQMRRRVCENPAPDNGGKECLGSDTELQECTMEACPVCSALNSTAHSILDCTHNNATDMISCTLKCEDGFEFDQIPKDVYQCGSETFYNWDFQTENNPYGRLPYCTNIADSVMMYADHQAVYWELTHKEADSNTHDLIDKKVVTATSQLTCVKSKTCSISDRVTSYFKSDMDPRNLNQQLAGFKISLQCESATKGSINCLNILNDAMIELMDLEYEDSIFDAEIDGTTYHISSNATYSDSRLVCPEGTVPTLIHCVLCSVGHFYKNEECLECPQGLYQDEEKQSHCKRCPTGTTTLGTSSESENDCNVMAENTLTIPGRLTFTLVAVFVTCSSVLLVVIIWKYRHSYRKKNAQQLKQGSVISLNMVRPENSHNTGKSKLHTRRLFY